MSKFLMDTVKDGEYNEKFAAEVMKLLTYALVASAL